MALTMKQIYDFLQKFVNDTLGAAKEVINSGKSADIDESKPVFDPLRRRMIIKA